MQQFIRDLCKYYTTKNIINDPVRNANRIEMAGMISYALSKIGDNKIWPYLDIILKHQKGQGYWEELSYEPNEEKISYYGAIPTAICILSLIEGYKLLKKRKYLYAAIRGCDFLYENEKNGYFIKASINKTDVLNTNLMCAVALWETAKELNSKSKRTELYGTAANRAVLRTIKSQLPSGAFPYTYCGFGVPFLYHPMTLALLIFFNREMRKEVISYAVKKGESYLRRIINRDGKFKWELANVKDKQGACWAYAWSYACIGNALHLKKLKNKKLLFTGDFSKIEDSFYTAWSIFAMSFRSEYRGKYSRLYYYILLLSSVPYRIWFIVKQAFRILTKSQLDIGPVEYW